MSNVWDQLTNLLNDARSQAARKALSELKGELHTAEQLAKVLSHPDIAALGIKDVFAALVDTTVANAVAQSHTEATLLPHRDEKDTNGHKRTGRPPGRAAEVDEIRAATDSRYYITKRSFWRNLPAGVSQRQTLVKLRELKEQGLVDIKKGRGGWIRWGSAARG